MKKVIVMSFMFLVAFNADAAQKVKNCGSAATTEVNRALDFVQDNIGTIMSNTSNMNSKEKKKLRKKVTKTNLKCMDHKNVCKKDTRRMGVSRHVFNKAVVLCYNSLRDFYGNNSFCALVDTIAHEIAHVANVHKAKDHNDGPNNDRVYRLGDSAESLCNSRGLDRNISRNTND